MSCLNRRQFLESTCLTAGACLTWGSASAWGAVAPGVETKAAPVITGEERNLQPDIWALEVNFKPLRLIRVDLPDARTGKTTPRMIWYIVYRVVNRPADGTSPAQSEEAAKRPIFVPEFTLVTEDEGAQKVYLDRVMPVAQAAINKRERHHYKNSVEIVGPIPPITPLKAKLDKSLDGMATWRGIDPATDHFKVYMTGFSNGYRTIAGPNGEEVVQRKTLVQQFWRPGDRFEQHEAEIRIVGAPQWIYR